MKISNKIKLAPNIMLFAFFVSKSVSFPSEINSGPKISLPGPALSLPGTCIIISRDLHYCFRGHAFSLPGPALLLPGLHYHFQGPALLLLRTCIFSSRTCIIASGPALFYRNHFVTKNKIKRKEINLIGTVTKMPFEIRET